MTDPRPTFEQTLERARAGTPWALGSLYRRYQPGLLRLLAVIAPHQAEDIASDVWLEVAGAVPRFSGDEGAFRAWLATIARRRVIDAHRRSGRFQPARPGPERTEDDAVDDLEFASAMARVASVLSADQADVVLLRMGGLDVDEVARVLGKQPAAVRALQHRALRRLARQLDPEALSA